MTCSPSIAISQTIPQFRKFRCQNFGARRGTPTTCWRRRLGACRAPLQRSASSAASTDRQDSANCRPMRRPYALQFRSHQGGQKRRFLSRRSPWSRCGRIHASPAPGRNRSEYRGRARRGLVHSSSAKHGSGWQRKARRDIAPDDSKNAGHMRRGRRQAVEHGAVAGRQRHGRQPAQTGFHAARHSGQWLPLEVRAARARAPDQSAIRGVI